MMATRMRSVRLRPLFSIRDCVGRTVRARVLRCDFGRVGAGAASGAGCEGCVGADDAVAVEAAVVLRCGCGGWFWWCGAAAGGYCGGGSAVGRLVGGWASVGGVLESVGASAASEASAGASAPVGVRLDGMAWALGLGSGGAAGSALDVGDAVVDLDRELAELPTTAGRFDATEMPLLICSPLVMCPNVARYSCRSSPCCSARL